MKQPRYRCEVCGQQKRRQESMFRVWRGKPEEGQVIGLVCSTLCAHKMLKRPTQAEVDAAAKKVAHG